MVKKGNKFPDLLLVCKFFNILPDNIKSFKSSSMLLAKIEEKTFEELISVFGIFERHKFAININTNEDVVKTLVLAKTDKKI